MLAIFLSSCTSMLYAPDRIMYVDRKKLNPQPEDVNFSAQTVAGEQGLVGWYFASSPKPKAVIVYFHGNGQNRSAHFMGLYWLIKEGYDLFIFDYPGYGDIEGEATPKNTIETGEAAIRVVMQKKPGVPLIIYGQSLGGAVALRTVIEMKKEIQPKLIVADSTFLSYRSAAKSVLSRHWLTWAMQPFGWLVMSDAFAPKDRIQEISPFPLLVIHSKEDQIINYDLGREVFDRAAEPKEMWTLEKGGHIETFSGRDMLYAVQTRKKFLAKLEAVLK